MSFVAPRLYLRRFGPAPAFALALASLLLLGGCDRPLLPERPPVIEIVSPELGEVQTAPAVALRLRATSFRPVSRVEVDGEPLTFSEQAQEWRDTLHLEPGLNLFVLTATDAQGVEGVDTLRAVYIPLRLSPAGPELPEPRGGHTATLLPSCAVLVAGGAPSRSDSASGSVFFLPGEGTAFTRADASLHEARTGHTATLLPDGRVLILGGARRADAENPGAFVQEAELYDPETGTFTILPTDAEPIRRMYHTAGVFQEKGRTYVFTLGGQGFTSASGTARPLTTLFRYELRNDSLVAVGSPARWEYLRYPITGATQTEITGFSNGGVRRYLIAGTLADRSGQPDAFLLEAPSYDAVEFAARPLPRIHHAGVEVLPGFVALLGGLTGAGSDVSSADEVFLAEALRFWRVPDGVAPQKRFGHTATKLPSQRILLLGGFDPSGAALAASEYLITDAE